MSFRSINQRFLVPGAQGLMIFGIISLCQPWSEFLHQYGVTMTLFGLIAFMVTSKIEPDPEVEKSYVDESLDVLEINDGGHTNGSKTTGSL